jgi:hypothetical protein
MTPVPTPLHPFLVDAKDTWKAVETLMDWFSRLVTTAYGYSDSLIKYRQDQADKKYKIEKAEKEALRIMKEQEKKRTEAVSKNLKKRSTCLTDEWFDYEGLEEFLKELEE